jgi:hypothetical protein
VFGCFRRLASLVVLGVVAVAAFLTRDLWLPKARALVGQVAGAESPATDSAAAAAATAADTGWMTLSYGAAEKGQRAIARLRSGTGPTRVSLSASEFASAALDSLIGQLPASTDSLQVRTSDNEFQVRALVRLADLGGRQALGPLASMLGDRERLTLGGTLEPTAMPGVAQFRLTRVKVGDFAIPGPVVPRLITTIRRRNGPVADGVDASALPIRLPAGIGDIRAGQGRITLYRITP